MDETLSERLLGIVDAMTVCVSTMLAQCAGSRLKPEDMDVLRQALELYVRAAALEGARAAPNTSSELVSGELAARSNSGLRVTQQITLLNLPAIVVE